MDIGRGLSGATLALVALSFCAGCGRRCEPPASPEAAAPALPAPEVAQATEPAEESSSLECWRVTVQRDGGGTTEVRGLIVNEDPSAIWVRTVRQKEPLRVDKSRVVSRERDPCDPADLRAAVSADKEARAELADLRDLIGHTQWKTVRERIDAFPTMHPQASEAVRRALEDLKCDFGTKRKAWFSDQAGKQFVPVVVRILEPKVRLKDARIQDVLGWARKDLVDEAIGELTKRFGAKDPVVTPEETRAFWDSRPKKPDVWNRARYGSGSFLIEPPTVRPPAHLPAAQPGGGGGTAPEIQVPKPPTRDSWWEKADAGTRAEWVFASFVESSGLFEVSPERERVNCMSCEGQGLITKITSGGGAIAYLCPRCGGSRYDVIVRYR